LGFLLGFLLKHETGWLGLVGVVVVLRWLGFLLGFLLKHETGWLGLAGVVVVNS
jgi:hypothetical protein